MATHTHDLMRPCRATSRSLTVLGIALATALTLPMASGIADPAPTTGEVQAKVDALALQVDEAVEDYQQAQVQLDTLRLRVQTAQADVARQRAAFDAVKAQAADVVASAYRNAGSEAGFSLLTKQQTPQAYLERATSLDRIANDQARRLAAVTTARTRLDAAVKSVAADVAQQTAVEQQAAARKASIESDLTAQQALLGSLQEQQRAALAAADAARDAQDAARSQAAVRASRDRVVGAPAPAAGTPAGTASSAGTAAAPPAAAPAVAASGRAGAAVAAAYSRLGKPYVWGASGPNSFDCSGLTAWAWAHAGVSLPHSSRAQYGSGPHIAQSQVQPGDLVFFGSPIHHVGIYIGGGNMISAPHTGDVVKIQPAFRGDYVGAARP